ncbi:hypothetical protein [Rhizorhapis suberifaciens]|uniref:Uncharacterized protein n=1 Tax=Rhizorhapis suberifaciens TaxID=13656 RepID=A0A840HXH1_9SPHN|nr:hypothetical protein [Rhizorhapis suberifaciens]MBB4642351.1 hypothetical protein [Rhizorhapis suberifaciens]
MRMRHADTKTITAAAAKAQLKMMLTCARSIDHLTVDGLARMYRVRPKEIEIELTAERERRERLI